MHKYLLVLLLFFISHESRAIYNLGPFYIKSSGTPHVLWTRQDGAAGSNAAAKGIAVDSSGNAYVTGTAYAAIDGQTLHGTRDLIIIKYDTSGTRQWTVQDGTSGNYVEGWAIAVDSSGNSYVTGRSCVALDGQTLHGVCDLFITKYNTSGTRQWTVEDGVSGALYNGTSITVDGSGNIYVAGWGSPGATGLDGQTAPGTNDLFVTKYNSSAVRQWTVEDAPSSGYAYAYSVAVDASGNVFITGYTQGSLDSQTTHGTSDMIIVKYNSSGTRQWTVQDGAPSGNAYGYGIGLDSSGNIYVGGYVSGSMDSQSTVGSQDLYITKYNTSGTRQWTTQDGVASGSVFVKGISVDSSGNSYMAGYTTKGFDGNSLIGTDDLILTKYNASGARQWTIEDGASGGVASAYGVQLDSAGAHAYVGGTTTAGLDGQTQIGTTDLMITKY